jgi:hypothetical protein
MAHSVTMADITRGLDRQAVADLAAYCSRPRGNFTVRGFSVSLYNDSGRLAALTRLLDPVIRRARRNGVAVPGFPEEIYPETIFGGRFAIYLDDGKTLSLDGGALGLAMAVIDKIRRIEPLRAAGAPLALTVENKESFYALSASPDYDCYLYTSGYPNCAVKAMLDLLAARGFVFFHAGDLDPDGILILERLNAIAGCRVRPVKMDAATLTRYLPFSRRLRPETLKSLNRVGDAARRLPGIAGLITRIAETGRGLDQEIIDYG